MAQQYRTVAALAEAAATKQDVRDAIAADPVTALNRLAEPLPDTGVYRIVVAALGIVVVLTVIGAAILAGLGDPAKYKLPDGIIAIGAAAGGALAGLLAPSPKGG
jgi:hypothetical protein